MAEVLADDFSGDDRRRVVGAGNPTWSRRPDRRPAGDRRLRVTKYQTSTVIATRGERLALSRDTACRSAIKGRRLSTQMCSSSARSTPTGSSRAAVTFDPDDIDAAFEELDARYLAGEAAAHGQTWSVIARTYTMFNRRDLPATDAGHHRPSARYTVRPRRSDRCHAGIRRPHARPRHLHRGSASAQ